MWGLPVVHTAPSSTDFYAENRTAALPAHFGPRAEPVSPPLLAVLGALRRAGARMLHSRRLRLLAGHGRRLQVQETVQLGEKRFVAILRVDGEQFLIGGSANGISLLGSLHADATSSVTSENASQPAPALSFGAALEHQERQRGMA